MTFQRLASNDASQWHTAVKDIYRLNNGYLQYAKGDNKYGGRIIPFCTNLSYNATCLIIGTNHSDFIQLRSSDWFDKNKPGVISKSNRALESERIAILYSTCIQSVNTYEAHSHVFARRLRRLLFEIIADPSYKIKSKSMQVLSDESEENVAKEWSDKNCIGTNRCPIQTGGIGTTEAKSNFPNTGGFGNSIWHTCCQTKMDRLLVDFIEQVKPLNVLLFGADAQKIYASEKFNELSLIHI